MTDQRDPASYLPLKPVHSVILVSLLEEERYGYALVKDIERRTEGRLRLEPGNLYRFVRQLLDLGLVEETGLRPVDTSDERRRYYAITVLGRAVMQAEAARMKALVRQVERLGRQGGRA